MPFWKRRSDARDAPAGMDAIRAELHQLEQIGHLSDAQVIRYHDLAHRRDLSDWRASGVVAGYRTIAAVDACPACQQLATRRFRIDEPCPLPHPQCSQTVYGFCRCSLAPILDVEWTET